MEHSVYHSTTVAGGNTCPETILLQIAEKTTDSFFHRYLAAGFFNTHINPALLNLFQTVRYLKLFLKIDSCFRKAHSFDFFLQLRRTFVSKSSQILNINLLPHPHGIHQCTVQIKNNRLFSL